MNNEINKVNILKEPVKTAKEKNTSLQIGSGGENNNNTLSLQDDVAKMEKLSMINASARFELLNANQQLLDFQMNRYIKYDQKKKKINQERDFKLNLD